MEVSTADRTEGQRSPRAGRVEIETTRLVKRKTQGRCVETGGVWRSWDEAQGAG